MRAWVLVPALLAVLLATPDLATAAATVQADARSVGAPALAGVGEVTAGVGMLELAPAASGLRLSWSSAIGYAMVQSGTRSAGLSYSGTGPDPEPLAWERGSLSTFRCAHECRIRIFLLEADAGEVGLSGSLVGAPDALARARVPTGDVKTAAGVVAFPERANPAWLVAEARAEGAGYALSDGVAHARGTLQLTLWNVTATRTGPDITETVAAGETRTPRETLAGMPLQEDDRASFLVMTLQNATVDTPPGTGVILAAPALDVRLDGRAAWPAATGRVLVGSRATELRGESLDVEGSTLALHVASPLALPDAAEGAIRPVAASALGGDATSVRVAGRELVPLLAAVPARETLGVVSALGLLAIALLLARAGAWTALYSRVTRSSLFSNDNRLAAYDLILARPGLHVSEISRAVRVSRVVLQHHLRMLEAHRLVVARTLGRVKAYYPAEGGRDEHAARVEVALKDPTRARVLGSIQAAGAGLTQQEIAERTGSSPRLVSYHIARLLELGLVEGHGYRPRRFVAAARVTAGPSVH